MPPLAPLTGQLPANALVSIDAPLPSEPAVRAIVDDVVNKIRFAFAAAAAADTPGAPGRADRIFAEFLASRSPAARAAYRARAGQLLSAPPSTRAAHFGRFATVDPLTYRTVGADKIGATVGALALDRTVVQKEVVAVTERALRALSPTSSKIKLTLPTASAPHSKPMLSGLPKPPDPADLKAGLAYKKLKLFITRVRCVQETDEVGSDEITMGGSAVDTKGDTHIVGDFMVHDDFDKGEHVDLGFSRTFFTWDLATNPAGFPYVYGAVIVMAEKDEGGFYKMLKELWEVVSAEVKMLIGAGAGILIGSILGGPFAAFGAVVGAAVGAIIGWLISLLDANVDDFIQARALTMTLTSTTKSYYDWAKLTSPQGWTKTIRFKGDGGIYDVDIAYRVFI